MRMMLTNIVDEIRVNRPINVSPKDLIKNIIEINPWVLVDLSTHDDLETLLREKGYPSLEEFIYEMGYDDFEEDNDEEDNGEIKLDENGIQLIELIQLYYKIVKKGDLLTEWFQDDDVEINSPIAYKNINIINLGDGDGYILYCHNF